MDNSLLQDIAVRCTTQFLSHKTPLSESLAKEASDHLLNPEQVKRAVEATNTLCYLKVLEKSAGDRTPEFPVAEFNDVIRKASMPDNIQVPENKGNLSGFPEIDFGKQASANSEFPVEFPTLSVEEAKLGLRKQAAINKRALEEAQDRSVFLTQELIKTAALLKKDDRALEKISHVAGEHFPQISRLVFSEEKTPRTTVDQMFKFAELNTATKLVEMYKEASELVKEIQSRSGLDKQASEYMAMEKTAFLAGLAGMAGRALGGLASKALAPVKGLSRAAAKGLNNVAADTGLGKAMLMNKKPINPAVKKTVAASGVIAGGALDAAMYRPKQSPNGNGGDVWNKLWE